MVTRRGHVKVLDFGVAKLVHLDAPALTRTGLSVGTPFYMSPEPIRGRAVDGRTDLYAMGVIRFEASTGHKPFVATTLYDVYELHLHHAPPAPRTLRPQMPSAFEAVMLKAMQKVPEHRFGGAAEMGAALAQAAAQLPPEPDLNLANLAPELDETALVETDPTEQQPVVQPRGPASSVGVSTAGPGHAPVAVADARRRRWPMVVLVLMALLVAAGTGIATFSLLRSRRSAAHAVAPPVVDAAALQATAGASPDASRVAVPVVNPGPRSPGPRVPAKRKLAAPAPVPAPPAPDAAVKPAASSGVVKIETARGAAEPRPGVERSAQNEKSRQRLTLPVDYPPRGSPALSFLPRAVQHARKLMSDAVLVDFDAQGVFADGHVDLTLKSDYRANYTFRSPSRSKGDSSLPANVEQDLRCLVHVEVSARQVAVYSTTSVNNCPEKPRRRWRCSMKQVMELARSEGAPAGNLVAKVSWLWDGWYVDYGETSLSVKDSCR